MQRGILIVKEEDFEVMKPLGEGKAGCVQLVRYLGNNTELLKICPTRLYALKKFKRGVVNANEIEITQAMGLGNFALYEETSSLPEENSLIMHKVLIMSFIHYDDHHASSNLNFFLKHLCNNTPFHRQPDKFSGLGIQSAFAQNHLAITLCQIFYSIKRELNRLHAKGFYHLDLALRNFLIDKPILEDGQVVHFSVKLVDYGLSQRITHENNGVVTISPKELWPIKSLDRRCLLKNEATLATDLYALRIVCLGMLGILYGKKETDIIRLPFENTSHLSSFLANFKYQENDADRLLIYLNKVKKLMAKHHDFRQSELALFLGAYGSYLISPPSARNLNDIHSIEEARVQDNALFTQATEEFIKAISERKYQQLPTEILRARLSYLQIDLGQHEAITPRLERTKTGQEQPEKFSNDYEDYAAIVFDTDENINEKAESAREELRTEKAEKKPMEMDLNNCFQNCHTLFVSKDDRIVNTGYTKVNLRHTRS